MPDPTRNDLNPDSQLLSDFTVAAIQDAEDFVLNKGPVEEVERREGKYFTYTTGDWNRAEMQPRGPSEESAGSGWKVSTDTYYCERFAVHKDNEWLDEDDAPPSVDLRQDSIDWLANQAMIKGDILFAATCWQDGTWTTDYDGVSGTPSTNEFKQWDASGSDPQANIEVLKAAIRALIGKQPNTLIVGEDVHTTLVTHSVYRDAVKHTSETNSGKMHAGPAAFFGVENYIVARGQYNSAAEGQTATMVPLCDADDLLLCYLDPNAGKKSMTAFKTFVYSGRDSGSNGVVSRVIDMPWLTNTRYEIDYSVDVKLVAADAGAFVKTIVG